MLTYKALIEFLKRNEKGEERDVQFGSSAGRIGREGASGDGEGVRVEEVFNYSKSSF